MCREADVLNSEAVQIPQSVNQAGMVYLKPNTTLYSPYHGDKFGPIGTIKEEITASIFEPNYQINSNKTPVWICGYTHKNNISEGMKLEEEVVDLISDPNSLEKIKWQNHLSKYEYSQFITGLNDYIKVYTVDAYEVIGRPRIFLFFCDNKLCVISHRTAFWDWGKYGVTEKGQREYLLLFLTTFPNTKKEKFLSWYKEMMSNWG